MTKARDNANNWAGDVTLTGTETLTNKTVQAANSSTSALIAKGAASQSANLQEWQNSSATALARVSSSGAIVTSGVGVLGSQSPINNSQLTVVNGNASYSAVTVRGAGSQSANLQEWQNSAGTVLASIKADGTLNAPLVTNAQVGTTYTLALSDAGKMLEVSNASAITVTVPLNSSVAFPVGTQVNLLQTGAGQITVAGAGGVTVNATPGLNLRAQWSSATLIKRATDTWVLVGDLSA